MNSTLPACHLFCEQLNLAPTRDPGIFGGSGQGATWLGKIRNLSNTGFQKIEALFHQTEFVKPHAIILDTPGQNLFSNTCKKFFHRIVCEKPALTLFDSFYTKKNFTISDKNIQELEEQLTLEMEKTDIKSGGPICIPLILGHHQLIERLHIVVIQIIDHNVYYYDSKGIASDLREIQDGTIRDFIELCQRKLTNGQGEIKENANIHQWDNYNCGAYACFYVFQTIIMGRSHEEIVEADISLMDIHRFRRAMASDFDLISPTNLRSLAPNESLHKSAKLTG